jgi:hypothetical protein
VDLLTKADPQRESAADDGAARQDCGVVKPGETLDELHSAPLGECSTLSLDGVVLNRTV